MVPILTVHKTTTYYTTPPVASRRLRARPYPRWKNFDELFLSRRPIHPQRLNSQLVVERRPCPSEKSYLLRRLRCCFLWTSIFLYIKNNCRDKRETLAVR
ncbi:unnamed protein product [Caenorhabditis auriculariae]|uniref:Uncharacterized protein n=1 Tax=Caenorhabditis auriculariae TaxID=2777116 RepID=A0A8S1HR92_9PELO|nr:unnamed protein product [Caenorhabditis auriculariae]